MPRSRARRRWSGATWSVGARSVARRAGRVGVYRDSVERRLTDLPVAGHPLQLRVRVPRYRCTTAGCERVIFCHDTSQLARAGATTTRRCARYVLRRLILDRVTVAAVARELGRSWDTVNTIAVEATTELLATVGPARLDGVRVIGVDEHRWAHTRHAAGEGYVTVIVDLTPSGRARVGRGCWTWSRAARRPH